MKEVDPKDARIAELQLQVAVRDKRIRELEGEVKQLRSQVSALLRRVAELEARLGLNSTNSSKPPSSDLPGVKRPRKPSTGRRPGGQRGHEKHERQLLPAEQVERVIDVPLLARECEGCGQQLVGRPGEAHRHQVVELPRVKPKVTEYRCAQVECARCGAVNRAKLAPEFAGHGFGERLTAMSGLLVGKYRMSKRLVQQALADLMGVKVLLGALSKGERELSEALAEPVRQAEQYVREQNAVHMDETSWTEGKAEGRSLRAWVWVMACASVAVFRISSSRGSEVAKKLL